MIFFSVVRSLKHRYVDLGWKMKGFDVFHAGLLAYVLNKIEKRAHVLNFSSLYIYIHD